MTDRNAPCPCGSGKKYKKCCVGKPGTTRRAAPARPAASRSTAKPTNAQLDAALNRAFAAHDAGNYAAAAQLYEQVHTARPRDPRPLVGLARIDALGGNIDRALDRARTAVDLDAKQAPAWEALADLLIIANRPEDAIAPAQRAIAILPTHAPAHRVLAAAYERTHNLDKAVAAAQRAVDIDPEFLGARLTLAQLLRRTGRPAEARAILEPAIDRAANNAMRAMIHKELARACDAAGDPDACFAALTRAGSFMLDTPLATKFDPDTRIRDLAQFTDACTAQRMRDAQRRDLGGTHPGETGAHPRLAFLIGHPRSGTTMTEQVLAAHPSIHTSDEETLLNAAIAAVGGSSAAELIDRAAALDRAAVIRVRAQYWRTVTDHFPEATDPQTVFIDKLPLNLLYLGFINMIFPDAKIITALRDPRDVIFSCFMQQFTLNAAMVNYLDWQRAATFYAAVMSFWLTMRDRITLPWIEVRYEDTVTDLAAQARHLLDHLDLPFDASVLNFHETARERAISTPSYAAVTEQVHTRAVARWKRYEKHYEPILPELRPFIEAFGYA